MTAQRKTLNLALQGGGAPGALTWGVLDRLLEEPRLCIEAISGTSAGAMNAAALASGWVEGGREGARESLPTSTGAIRARVVDFQFNAAFLREMRSLAIAKREIDKEWLPLGKLAKKVKQLNFRLIEADDMIGKMRIEKSFNADPRVPVGTQGRRPATSGACLEQNAGFLGQRSSIDLNAFV